MWNRIEGDLDICQKQPIECTLVILNQERRRQIGGGLSTIHNLITKTRLLESMQADTMQMTKGAQIKMPFRVTCHVSGLKMLNVIIDCQTVTYFLSSTFGMEITKAEITLTFDAYNISFYFVVSLNSMSFWPLNAASN